MLNLSVPDDRSPLRVGAVLAGGQSRRFGSPKQHAEVGGVELVERVAMAVRSAGAHAVAIVAPDTPDLSHRLPCRVDAMPGNGPLGGVFTALGWARELGIRGVLCVACDLPFLPSALLRHLAEEGERVPGNVVVPESRGPAGVEPLCAWYPVEAVAEMESRLRDGRLSLVDLLQALQVRGVPLAEVAVYGDPDTIFLNVNRPADRTAAEAMLLNPQRRNGDG